jgi:hypothetical protein
LTVFRLFPAAIQTSSPQSADIIWSETSAQTLRALVPILTTYSIFPDQTSNWRQISRGKIAYVAACAMKSVETGDRPGYPFARNAPSNPGKFGYITRLDSQLAKDFMRKSHFNVLLHDSLPSMRNLPSYSVDCRTGASNFSRAHRMSQASIDGSHISES